MQVNFNWIPLTWACCTAGRRRKVLSQLPCRLQDSTPSKSCFFQAKLFYFSFNRNQFRYGCGHTLVLNPVMWFISSTAHWKLLTYSIFSFHLKLTSPWSEYQLKCIFVFSILIYLSFAANKFECMLMRYEIRCLI